MGSVNPPETYPVVPSVEHSSASRTNRTNKKVRSSLFPKATITKRTIMKTTTMRLAIILTGIIIQYSENIACTQTICT